MVEEIDKQKNENSFLVLKVKFFRCVDINKNTDWL